MLRRYGWPMVSVLALTLIASLAGFGSLLSPVDQTADFVQTDCNSDSTAGERSYEDPSAGTSSSYSSLHFIDVGQGDAILIRDRERTVLIDGGPSAAGLDVVNYIQTENVHWLDYVIATHPHADHVGGLYSVVTMIPVGQMIDSRVDYSSQTYARLLAAVSRMELPYTVGTAGKELELGQDNSLSILWPPEQAADIDTNISVNDLSIVCLVQIGAIRVLLLGDISASVERTLVRNFNEDLKADVIKVSHHGSRHATSEELLLTVQPRLAIISVGAGNSYEHPSSEVIERLTAAGVEVYRTDERGTVVLYTDGRDIWVATER